MKRFILTLILALGAVIGMTSLQAQSNASCSPIVHWTGVSDVEFRLLNCQSDYHRCIINFAITNHMRKDFEVSLHTRSIEAYDNLGEKYTAADDTYKGTSLAEDMTGGWANVSTVIPGGGITVQMKIVINNFNHQATMLQLLKFDLNVSKEGNTQMEIRNLPIPYPCPVAVVEQPQVVTPLPVIEEPQAPVAPVKQLRKPRIRHNITDEQRSLWEEISALEPTINIYADHWKYEDSIVVKCTKCFYKEMHWICAFELTNHTLDTLVISLRDNLPIAVETPDILVHHDWRDCLVYSNEEWDFEPGETFVLPYVVKIPIEETDYTGLNFAKVFISVPQWREQPYETILYGLPILSLEE